MPLGSVSCEKLVRNVVVGNNVNLVEVLLFPESEGDMDLGFGLVIKLEWREGG